MDAQKDGTAKGRDGTLKRIGIEWTRMNANGKWEGAGEGRACFLFKKVFEDFGRDVVVRLLIRVH
jgi:hypothetical protein